MFGRERLAGDTNSLKAMPDVVSAYQVDDMGSIYKLCLCILMVS